MITIFTDEYFALQTYLKKNKNKEFLVKTSSPNILCSDLSVKKYDLDLLLKKKSKKLLKSQEILAKKIFKNLSQHKLNHIEKIFFTQLSYLIILKVCDLLFLSKDDLKKKIVCIKGNTKKNSFYDYLELNKNCEILRVEENFNHISGGPTRIEILKKLNRYELKYYFLFYFWKLSPAIIKKRLKKILILNDNPQLQEISTKFIKSGYYFEKVKLKNSETLLSNKDTEEVVSFFNVILDKIIKDFFKKWISNEIVTICYPKIKDEFMNEIKNFFFYSRININNIKNAKFLFSNVLIRSKSLGIANNFFKKKIPIISFQHGWGREIREDAKHFQFFKEDCTSNLAINFHKKSQFLEKKSLFSYGKSIPVGFCEIHKSNIKKKIKNIGKFDFIYVNTLLYSVNKLGPMFHLWTDTEKFLYEKKLIKIFGKLDKSFLFKLYPEQYYPDPYLIEKEVRKCKNIFYFNKQYNLKYLYPHYDIIITQQISSTLTTCFFSKKPIIYINLPSLSSFRKKEFFNDFSKSFLVLNGESKNFSIEFSLLLKKNKSELIRIWEKKKNNRDDFLQKYFDTTKISSSEIAFNYIKEL